MNPPKKSKFIWLGALAILISVSTVALLLYRSYNPRLGFAYYEPAYLPPNITILDKRVVISKWGNSVDLNFRTEDWVYAIRESASTEPLGTADQNYDQSSTLPTCTRYTSAQKTDYRLCHWVDYGRISVYEVKFKKGSTFVEVMMPSDLNTIIPNSELEKFIDSFEAKSTKGFPILRSNGP